MVVDKGRSFEDMTNVSKQTRTAGNVINQVDTMQRSEDGTVKNAVRA
jgi:23S rRNA (adenine2503-C2)-methyltransferase